MDFAHLNVGQWPHTLVTWMNIGTIGVASLPNLLKMIWEEEEKEEGKKMNQDRHEMFDAVYDDDFDAVTGRHGAINYQSNQYVDN